MRLPFCALCGSTEGLEHHHVIPRASGGTDDETNLLTVCHTHHGLIHGMRKRANISHLTKAALAAAKARGVKLGGNRGKLHLTQEKGSQAGVAALKSKADARAVDLLPIIEGIKATGAASLRQIAAALNAQGIPTARGGEWSAVQVQRVMER